MKKFLLVLFSSFIIAAYSQNASDSKSLKIFSLEGKECSIEFKTDLHSERLIIKFNHGQLCIDDFIEWKMPPKVHKKKFLEIQYKIRGGSGVKLRRIALLCVSHDKIYCAFDLYGSQYSLFSKTYSPIDTLNMFFEKSSYDFKILKVADLDNKSYNLTASEKYSYYSKSDPNKNDDTKDTIFLRFDYKLKVFYNQVCTLDGTFIINSANGIFERKIDFKDRLVLAIVLHKGSSSYFIDGMWYEVGKNNNLMRQSNNFIYF